MVRVVVITHNICRIFGKDEIPPSAPKSIKDNSITNTTAMEILSTITYDNGYYCYIYNTI